MDFLEDKSKQIKAIFHFTWCWYLKQIIPFGITELIEVCAVFQTKSVVVIYFVFPDFNCWEQRKPNRTAVKFIAKELVLGGLACGCRSQQDFNLIM